MSIKEALENEHAAVAAYLACKFDERFDRLDEVISAHEAVRELRTEAIIAAAIAEAEERR
jgi:hypothetical protein